MEKKILKKENDPKTALNIPYIKEKEIYPACISKINLNSKKQIVSLMIPNVEKEGWHYLAVKNYVHCYME